MNQYSIPKAAWSSPGIGRGTEAFIPLCAVVLALTPPLAGGSVSTFSTLPPCPIRPILFPVSTAAFLCFAARPVIAPPWPEPFGRPRNFPCKTTNPLFSHFCLAASLFSRPSVPGPNRVPRLGLTNNSNWRHDPAKRPSGELRRGFLSSYRLAPA